MISYNTEPISKLKFQGVEINSFIDSKYDSNIDWNTVNSFGEEWNKFSSFSEEEIKKIGDDYFDLTNEKNINEASKVLDVGCGSGRWTKYIGPKVNFVEAIDPSNAVYTASIFLKDMPNVRVTQASVEHIPFPDNSFDFVFSLGVLHHIPDTSKAMKRCIEKLKPGGHFLVYLYYNFDNRGNLFKMLFLFTNIFRKIISRTPKKIKNTLCDIIAAFIYLPISGTARILSKIPKFEKLSSKIPLSYYKDKSFQIMRNDALDRFGTPLEQRFSREQIEDMMKNAGLKNILFSKKEPYWHAIGEKK